MVSFQTTGELQPVPGTAVVHTTLSVVLQVSGSRGSSATPRAPGPRNWGHSCAKTGVQSNVTKAVATRFCIAYYYSGIWCEVPTDCGL